MNISETLETLNGLARSGTACSCSHMATVGVKGFEIERILLDEPGVWTP